jgi:hypothetical protein
MPLPSYKDIIELVKTGATIEAQEKIMELRQSALDGQEENRAISTDILEFRREFSSFRRQRAATGERR